VSGAVKIYDDVFYEESASRSLGRYLTSHPRYANAILVGEPDFALESLPYYASNPIYIARERRFGNVVHFVRSADSNLTLGDLLRAGRELEERTGRPTLLVLGHTESLGSSSARTGAIASGTPRFGRTFSWSARDLDDLDACARPLARFGDNILGDERYVVYELARRDSGPATCR
jgi:hypothetical protein